MSRLSPILVCVLMVGCTSAETAQPASVPPAASATPAAPAPSAPATSGFDGLYVGTAVSMRPGAPNCPSQLTLKNFRVEGGQVRFGGFQGPIQGDGSVQIPNRDVWLTGRFIGSEFRGEFAQFGGRGRASSGRLSSSHGDRCIFAVALKRESA
jgi:hypothetical protein